MVRAAEFMLRSCGPWIGSVATLPIGGKTSCRTASMATSMVATMGISAVAGHRNRDGPILDDGPREEKVVFHEHRRPQMGDLGAGLRRRLVEQPLHIVQTVDGSCVVAEVGAETREVDDPR